MARSPAGAVHAVHRVERRGRAYSWFHPFVISLALLLEGMSSSSINVQVGAIRDSLGLGDAALGLVVAVFLIGYAGLLPAAGQLVDAYDGRTIFLLGVAAFGLGCVLCSFAVDASMLVAGRFVQGAGAALSAPAALALITRGVPAGPVRNRAVALYGAMGAAGFSLGLVVPGFLVAAVGWRMSFLVLLPVVLFVAAGALTVPREADRGSETSTDLTGAMLLTVVLMIAVHAIGAIGALPDWLLVAEGAAACVLVAAIVRRGGVAGFPARVVWAPQVVGPCVALAAVFSGAIASSYVMSLALQAGGFGAFGIGLALLPSPVAFASLAGPGSRLVTRYGSGPVLAAGTSLIGLALAGLALADGAVRLEVGVPVAQAVIGAGLALTFPAASIRAVDAAPEAFRGRTAGLLTTWQNVGGALGLALVTAAGIVPAVGSTEAAPGLGAAAGFVLAGGAIAVVVDRRLAVRRGNHR